MSVEVYSECRIQVDGVKNKVINFERCLIELRQYDIGDYALRAIDLKNCKNVRVTCRYVLILNFLHRNFSTVHLFVAINTRLQDQAKNLMCSMDENILIEYC